jgi:hypothetical protein
MARALVNIFEGLCDRLSDFARKPWAFCLIVMLPLTWRLLSRSPADPDLFARVAMGRLIQETGSVPLQDPFAFTPKLPIWIDHEWLSGVFFLWVVQTWGDAGLVVSKLLGALASVFFIVQASRLLSPGVSGQKIWITACLLHASFLWGSTLRCQTFTYLFISYLLFALAHFQARNNSRYLWLMPILSVPWINLHGGWAMGMSVLGIFCIASIAARKPYTTPLVVTLLCFLAALCTPYGAHVFLTYLFEALTLKRTTISEWAPLASNLEQFVATAIFAILIAAGALTRRVALDLRTASLLGFSAYCAVEHSRFLGFFMFCAAVYGPPFFAALLRWFVSNWSSLSASVRRATTFVAATLLTWATIDLIRISTQSTTFRLDLQGYPTAALTFLETSGETGRLLVDFNNGSLALWRLYPQFLISLDGRYEEVYPESTVRASSQALLFGSVEGRRSLDAINPTHILTPSQYLHEVGLPSPAWSVIFDDGGHAVLRKDAANTPPPTAGPAPRPLWKPNF